MQSQQTTEDSLMSKLTVMSKRSTRMMCICYDIHIRSAVGNISWNEGQTRIRAANYQTRIPTIMKQIISDFQEYKSVLYKDFTD